MISLCTWWRYSVLKLVVYWLSHSDFYSLWVWEHSHSMQPLFFTIKLDGRRQCHPGCGPSLYWVHHAIGSGHLKANLWQQYHSCTGPSETQQESPCWMGCCYSRLWFAATPRAGPRTRVGIDDARSAPRASPSPSAFIKKQFEERNQITIDCCQSKSLPHGLLPQPTPIRCHI